VTGCGGTVRRVSADSGVLDLVVTRGLVFEAEGRVVGVVGGYADWQRERGDKARLARPAIAAAGQAPSAAATPAAPMPAAAPRATAIATLGSDEKRELDRLPRKIEKLEAEQQQFGDAMSRPEFFSQAPEKIESAQRRLKAVEVELAAAYARWEQLESRRG